MRTAAVYSIKGGVGKTSAAVNLAAAAAGSGQRVLLWDLDPQGAATYLFRVKPKVKGGGEALIERRISLIEAARATNVANLDLVPADFRYRHLDLMLDELKRPTRRLARLIEALTEDYDWVFLDCAPSISLVSEGVFEAADLLLVPIVPSTLSVRTLDQLTAFLDEAGDENRPEILAFFSMVDSRRALHRAVVDALPVDRPGVLSAVRIPSSAYVERMGSERSPISAFAPHSHAALAYVELWEQVRDRARPQRPADAQAD